MRENHALRVKNTLIGVVSQREVTFINIKK